jgi:hypothetical protein
MKNATVYVEQVESNSGTNYRLELTIGTNESGCTEKVDDLSCGDVFPTTTALKQAVESRLGTSDINLLESRDGVVKLWKVTDEFQLEELAITAKAMKQQGN